MSSDGLKILNDTVEKHPDFTIEEYTQIYNSHIPNSVSQSTIGRGLLKLTR